MENDIMSLLLQLDLKFLQGDCQSDDDWAVVISLIEGGDKLIKWWDELMKINEFKTAGHGVQAYLFLEFFLQVVIFIQSKKRLGQWCLDTQQRDSERN